MHGKELVVLVRGKKVGFGKRQLHSHGPGKQSGDEEEAEGRNDVSDSDRRMVNRLEPAGETFRFIPNPFKLAGLLLFGGGEFKLGS